MDRIHHPSAIATPPPVDAHATPGYPTEGNPGGGIEATIMTAYIGHSIIEEMRNVIVAAGITPDKANLAQLAMAVQSLSAPRMQVFTANGTFVVPAGVTRVRVRAWGGGASGATSSHGSYPGGGGGAGGYGEGVYNVTPGASITVTRGAGGTGGGGGSSSFGALLTAGGGSFGTAGSAGGVGAGGTGGTVSGAQLSVPGGNGSSGIYYGSPGGTIEGGNGGAAFGSSQVRAVGVAASNLNGNPGAYPGGGGSGGTGGSGGGPGANGCVVVEW